MADTDADLLSEAKEDFKAAEEASDENRTRSDEAIKFGRMGEQWDDAIRSQRELEGRPCLRFNMMPTKVRQVVNDSRQNKPGIRVQPVDGSGDKDVAEILNGIIRNIEVSSNADVAYDTAVDHAASGGFGYFRIDLEHAFEDAFDLDIRINRIMDPNSVYGDPKSKAADSSDWDVSFITSSLTTKEFERKYPKAKETISWQGSDSVDSGWKSEDQVRIAEWWKREDEERDIVLLSNGQVMQADELAKEVTMPDGITKIPNIALLQMQGITVIRQRTATFKKVTQRLVTGAEILKTVEWVGRYIPIVPVYGEEVIHGGKRQLFSLIHWGMDPQRVYNYTRSASVETAALQPKAPYIGWVGQFKTDAQRWASANTSNHAYLEADMPDGAPPTLPQRQSPPTPSAAWIAETKIAAEDIKATIGLHDASMGERSNETSGKAINARKLEGDVSTFHFIDNLSRAIGHGGRIILDLIQKIYDRPRMVRVLGEDRRETRMVQVGKPQQGQPQAMAGGGMGMQPQQPPAAPGMPGAPPAGPPQDPRLEAMNKVYDLSLGKYDVAVSAGPSFTTRREEAAAYQMEMVKAFPPLAMLTGDIIAKNQDWPGADEFAERIQMAQQQAMAPKEGKPEADPMQKAMVDAQARVKAAEIATQGRIQETQIKTVAQRQTDQERIVAEQQTAAQQQAVSAMAGQRPPTISPGGDIAR